MRGRGYCIGLCLLALSALGCQATRPGATSPLDTPVDDNVELMAYLGDQPYVTADAGYRAAHILQSGEVFAGDFNALREQLVADGLVCPAWNHDPGVYLNRGEIGYLVCRAAGVDTGLNWRLTGLGRYAYRELQYHRIAGPGGEWRYMSGGEFQGVLRRADEYMALHAKQAVQHAELGPQPGAEATPE